ncbi:Uncharacterized protein SCF082_LOCUS6020, partial [Durusdinium trenchii]
MSGKSTNPPTPRVFVYGAQLGLLVLCSCDRLELFDLLALRSDAEPSAAHGATHGASWALAAQELRRILSEESMLKVVWGGVEELVDIAIELGLGIAKSLKPNEKDPVGPVLNSQSLFEELELGTAWPVIMRRFTGLRLCLEEEGSNWARRPLRASQLHHAAVMTWTQLLLLHALCSRGIVKEESLRKHTCVQ